MFDELVPTVVPGLFQTTIKNAFNDEISRLMEGSACNPVEASSKDQFLDFRDFFLSAAIAKAKGGSGTKPFGDIGELLRSVIDDELVAVNPETGRPKVNEAVIAPLTGFQSGIDGTLRFNSTLIDAGGTLSIENFIADGRLVLSELRLENLDTVVPPLVIIEPSYHSGQELDNNLTMGLSQRPLRVGARLLVQLDGNGK